MTQDPSAPSEGERTTFDRDYFAKTYGGSAGSYEARTTPNKWRSMCGFIRTHVAIDRVEKALDVGCAEGAFLAYAVPRMPSIAWSGTDVSTYALDRAREKIPGVDLREATVASLPFADGAFQLCTAFDMLEHIPDLAKASAELARVIAPQGRLIVTVPVYDGPLGWLVNLLDRDPTHVHKIARGAWLEGPLTRQFELLAWDGAWRYYLGRYWHIRARSGRRAAPAIVMAWQKRG